MRRAATSLLLCVVVGAGAILAEDVGPQASGPTPNEVERYRAFAKMYGYVRFFHPSDEAASIDWERFAVLGAIRLRESGESGDLLEVMNRLFMPVAPTVRIYRTGSEPKPIEQPEASDGFVPVAWQHVGVRLPGPPSVFLSKRTHREARFSISGPFGTVIQTIDAVPLRGKQVKLIGSIRAEVEGEGNQGYMWMRVDRAGGERGFFDNMGDRPVTSDEWGEYEITGPIAEDAERVSIGCFLTGRGRVWFDHVRLAVDDGKGGWTSVELENPGFEAQSDTGKPVGWSAGTPGFVFEVTDDRPDEGERSVLITHQPDEVITEDLFDARPAIGEAIDVELGAGLSARIPLVAWSDESSTQPAGDEKALAWMRTELDSINMRMLYEFSECTRVAGIVMVWNVLQHFYPAMDIVDADWDAELTHALERVLVEESGEDYFAVLERLAVALGDGQARAYHYRYATYGYLPILVDWVEDQVVVTASAVDELQPGDVVSAVDGIDANEIFREREARISGSPQRKRVKSLRLFGSSVQPGESAALKVTRGETTFDLTIDRGRQNQLPSEHRPDAVSVDDDGVFYVDLTRARTSDVSSRISEIAAAPGVVFDLRGGLSVDHSIIGHLLTEPDEATSWMQAPEIIRPDGAGLVGWRDLGWRTEPAEPQITGEVAFLIDARTTGAAESVVDLVRARGLAEIVGQPTAGASGEVNSMTLPGGFDFRWTGVRVSGRDPDVDRRAGIQPSVPACRTIEGLRDGRDDILDTAMVLVNVQASGQAPAVGEESDSFVPAQEIL